MAFIFGVSFYLSPDDLNKCGSKPSSSVGCQKVDAIVVVSGGDTAARTSEAINLYNSGWADKVIFSGAAQDKTGQSNAAAMKDLAVKAGIPIPSINLDELAETTKQNAENSQKIFTSSNIKSVILVTSGYHQRRAGLEFSRAAVGVKILNHSVPSDKDWSNLWWLTPGGWWLALSELVKIIVFYVSGIL
jgi:uncharacterized SAM-binding protein YcdF (DUF218 family)